ncbi:uncharacterized protein Hap1MRO34_017575 isoform 2-T2 [Clarias gariepinus]
MMAKLNIFMLVSYQMPRKNKRSQAQKNRWRPLDLVDPAVPPPTVHNQDEVASDFPSEQRTPPARPSRGKKNRPTSSCSLRGKISDSPPPAKPVGAADDFHKLSTSPPQKIPKMRTSPQRSDFQMTVGSFSDSPVQQEEFGYNS